MPKIVRLMTSGAIAVAVLGGSAAHATNTCETVAPRPGTWATACVDPADPDHDYCARAGAVVLDVVYLDNGGTGTYSVCLG